MKSKIKLLWHVKTNTLAIYNSKPKFPEIHLCPPPEGYTGRNPYIGQPIEYLWKYMGWVVLGDMK